MALKLSFNKVLVKDTTDRIKLAESQILQQANEIALRVRTEDYNGNEIASLINQSATTIKLKAEKIEMEGLITANGNFKVLLDGSIEAVNAKLSGAITATKMVAASGDDYYGEIGVTGGLVGFGLFDRRYGTEAFFEVLETSSGNGFSIRDKTNRSRITVNPSAAILVSPTGRIVLNVTDNYVNIIKDGNVIGNWG